MILGGLIDILNHILSFIGLDFWQAFWMMIIPIIVDLPRTLGKTIILFADALSRKLRPRRELERYPSISVIVPAHNMESTIERCIESLLEAYYPGKKEIIVIDDGSTDRTFEKMLKYRDRVKIIRRKECSGTKAVAVNTGIPFSSGELLILFDADTFVERTALVNIVKPFADPKVGAVSGNVRVFNHKQNLLTKVQAYEYMTSMEIGRRYQAIVETLLIVPGAFGAVRREIFEGVGVYDLSLSEDFDSTLKIHKTRRKVKFASDAVAYTIVPHTLRSWIRQRIRWARGEIHTLIKHRNMFFKPFFKIPGLLGAPDMFFMDVVILLARAVWILYLILSYWWVVWKIVLLISIFYMFLEAVTCITGGLLSSRKDDFRYAIYLPVISLVYRPLHDLIRLIGYLKELCGAKAEW